MRLVFGSPGRDDGVLLDERLRLAVVTLGAGDDRAWPDTHGEEAVYVLDGAVELDGVAVPTGGAVILHADAPCRLTAPVGARLACFSAGLGPPGRAEHRSVRRERHVVGPSGWYRSGSPGGSQAVWFADSTCEGCDVALFRVERDTPGNRGRTHRHSADEILLLVEGGIRLGAHAVPTGHAVLIPADTPYAVTSGETKHAFLNYRPTASIQRYEGDPDPLPETGLGRGGELVGDFLE